MNSSSSRWCCSDFACSDLTTWDACNLKCISSCSHYMDALRNKRKHEFKIKLWELAYMCCLFGCNDTCPIYGFCEGRFKKQAKEIMEELRK